MSKLASNLGTDAKYVINPSQERALLELEKIPMRLTLREVSQQLWRAHIQHCNCTLTPDGEIETGLAAHGSTQVEALLALLVCCHAEGHYPNNRLNQRFSMIKDRLCDLLGCREPGHAGHICPNGWSYDLLRADGTIENQAYCPWDMDA